LGQDRAANIYDYRRVFVLTMIREATMKKLLAIIVTALVLGRI